MDRRRTRLRVTAEAGEAPQLRHVAAFVWDLNLLYELEILSITNPSAVAPGRVSPWLLSRNGRRIPAEQRLRVEVLRLESPIDLITLVPQIGVGIAAAWAIVQIVDKLYDLGVDHNLKEQQVRVATAQADQLELQNRKLREDLEAPPPPVQANDVPSEPSSGNALELPSSATKSGNAFDPRNALERRLRKSRIIITRVELELPGDDDEEMP